MAQSGSSQDELDSLVYYRFLLVAAIRPQAFLARSHPVATPAFTSLGTASHGEIHMSEGSFVRTDIKKNRYRLSGRV